MYYNICSIRTSWIILVPRLRENGIGIVNETHWIDSDLKKHRYVLLKALAPCIPIIEAAGIDKELGWAWIIPCSRIIYMTMPETQKKNLHEEWSHHGCTKAIWSCAQLLFLTHEALQDFPKSLGPSCFHGTMVLLGQFNKLISPMPQAPVEFPRVDMDPPKEKRSYIV